MPKKSPTKYEYPSEVQETPPKRARTPEGRENQLIALAYDLVEKRLREGTATSQETTHFLRMGSPVEKMEKELLEVKKDLMIAKAEQLSMQKRLEDLYEEAMAAFTSYGGRDED